MLKESNSDTEKQNTELESSKKIFSIDSEIRILNKKTAENQDFDDTIDTDFLNELDILTASYKRA